MKTINYKKCRACKRVHPVGAAICERCQNTTFEPVTLADLGFKPSKIERDPKFSKVVRTIGKAGAGKPAEAKAEQDQKKGKKKPGGK